MDSELSAILGVQFIWGVTKISPRSDIEYTGLSTFRVSRKSEDSRRKFSISGHGIACEVVESSFILKILGKVVSSMKPGSEPAYPESSFEPRSPVEPTTPQKSFVAATRVLIGGIADERKSGKSSKYGQGKMYEFLRSCIESLVESMS